MQDEINKELNELIRGELINYIIAELRNGYDLDSIKKVLHKKHREDLVTQAIEYLKNKDFNLSPLDERKENIPLRVLKESQDFDRILMDLKRYIRYKLDEGYDLEDIKQALLRFGHYYDLIDHTIKNIQNMNISVQDLNNNKKEIIKEIKESSHNNSYNFLNKILTKNFFDLWFSIDNIVLILLLIFTFVISSVTESPLFVILYSFLPIYFLNFLLRYKKNILNLKILIIYALLFVMFYSFNFIYEPFGMNINSIIIYNVIFVILHFSLSNVEIKKERLINKDNKKEENKSIKESEKTKLDEEIKSNEKNKIIKQKT